jgi:ABC-type multidrug transport system fused ATPase/permease subunit
MSSDLAAVDLKLPNMFDHFSQMMIVMVILLTTICIMVPWMALFVIVLMPLYFLLDFIVNKSSREVKRLTNTAMSPILTLVQEAAQSRLLLRVTRQGPWLLEKTVSCVDVYNSGQFASQSLMSFLRMVGTTIGATVSIFLCIVLWAYPDLTEMTPGGPVTLGLALTYSFVIPYFLSFVSLFFSMLRLLMASLERLLELQSSDLVPQEKPWNLASDPNTSWPPMGKIEMKNVSMCYRPGLPPAVDELTLTINGGERLGVVGRTGAGKSSLSILMLRIVELSGGVVLIDDVDVSQIGLHRLRKAVSVVPQDPVLFKGQVGQNLDRFNNHPREALSKAIDSVGLSLKLEDDVGGAGENLSSGERQLVAIARATLSSARIVLMDEPTAACDAQTDAHLQEVVRIAFSQRTVLCIAHRLNTIMTYDRVLVMEAGKAVELDTPDALMADPRTRFAQMVAGMQTDRASSEEPNGHTS